MPQDLHRTINDLMTAYAARPAGQSLTPLNMAEQLEAWRHAAGMNVTSETMTALMNNLETMVREAQERPHASSAGLAARIVTGFRRDEQPVDEKPEPMLVEMTCEGRIAGYVRLDDRPLRVTSLDQEMKPGLQWICMETLGHAILLVENHNKDMMVRDAHLGEWMTDFSSVAGHCVNGDFQSVGGEVLVTLTEDGVKEPNSWVLRQPNGNHVVETIHGTSRYEFGTDIAGAALELMAGYDAQGGTVRVLSDDESVMAAFVAEGYEQEPAITPSP